jgi:hypothetical protein
MLNFITLFILIFSKKERFFTKIKKAFKKLFCLVFEKKNVWVICFEKKHLQQL